MLGAITEASILKAVRSHLRTGEELVLHFPAGRRVLALSSQPRILCCDIPFLFGSKLLRQLRIDELDSLDFLHAKPDRMAIIAAGPGGTARIEVPLTVPSVGKLAHSGKLPQLIRKAHRMQPRTKPAYLDEGDELCLTICTDHGTLRLTHNHLLLLEEARGAVRVLEQAPLRTVRVFDGYLEGVSGEGLRLHFALRDGRKLALHVSASVFNYLRIAFGRDERWLLEELRGRVQAPPPYLEPGEEPRLRIPAWLPDNARVNLLLTDRRLVAIQLEQDGGIALKTACKRVDIHAVDVETRYSDHRISHYLLHVEAGSARFTYQLDQDLRELVAELSHPLGKAPPAGS